MKRTPRSRRTPPRDQVDSPPSVDELFADAKPTDASFAHCRVCVAGAAPVIRATLEAMLDGRVPLWLTIRHIYDKLVNADDATRERFGFQPLTAKSGALLTLNTFSNHVRLHEKELWDRVKEAKRRAGFRVYG